ncbi:MAG TPA: hypothetical protein VGR73_05350 [Bryobacteraceae bacterium]|nr:hypothetical protein [Bryobacteraceae bacterium]
MPAGAHRRLRDESQANPNPFRIGSKGWIQDSKQTRDYLLCCNCEQRLSRGGENWFLRNCWQDGGLFPLKSTLETIAPTLVGQRFKMYCTASISAIDKNAFAYFAASEFWRASVHRWPDAKGIRLGPYEEDLRKYLMGEAPFPEDCALWVSISDTTTPMTGLVLSPYGDRHGPCHAYKLVVLGVGFNLLVGKRIPQQGREMCFVRGVGNPIFRTDMLEDALLKDIERKHRSEPRLMESLHAGSTK